ncbi:MAG: YdcF family protein [Moraxellaceae bacterium]
MSLALRLLLWMSRVATLAAGLALLFFVAISTPFLAKTVLWGLQQIPIKLDPVAAAAHASGALVQPKTPLNADVSADVKSLVRQQQAQSTQQIRLLLDEAEYQKVLSQLPQHTLDALQPSATQRYVALPNASATIAGQTWYVAQAIVVLGGGLGRDHTREIVPNTFTELRLSQAILQQQATGLPLFLSGVEAPWMQQWLLAQGVEALWLEPRSMNTCENARFSALLLLKQGGAARVELVTDAYHMPRARRLFAQNGIDTVPVIAPLPADPSVWWPDRRNLVHTRRALHELAASVRDLWVGEINCREVP